MITLTGPLHEALFIVAGIVGAFFLFVLLLILAALIAEWRFQRRLRRSGRLP